VLAFGQGNTRFVNLLLDEVDTRGVAAKHSVWPHCRLKCHKCVTNPHTPTWQRSCSTLSLEQCWALGGRRYQTSALSYHAA